MKTLLLLNFEPTTIYRTAGTKHSQTIMPPGACLNIISVYFLPHYPQSSPWHFFHNPNGLQHPETSHPMMKFTRKLTSGLASIFVYGKFRLLKPYWSILGDQNINDLKARGVLGIAISGENATKQNFEVNPYLNLIITRGTRWVVWLFVNVSCQPSCHTRQFSI